LLQQQHLQAEKTQLLADKQQLEQHAGLQPLQSQLQASEAMLRKCLAQLSTAELSHATEKSKLQQQLNAAQQQLRTANASASSRSNNNSAVSSEALNQAKAQAAQFKAQADEAAAKLAELQEQLNNQSSKVSSCETEKQMLLESVQSLLATNKGLQEELVRLRQVRPCGFGSRVFCSSSSAVTRRGEGR
jgi:chromosome segregation ATPase